MITYLDFTHFFNGQVLSVDGSNFTKRYLRLRTSLQHNDAHYTVIEPLGSPPGEDADQTTVKAFRYR
jgi:hypothetical protein